MAPADDLAVDLATAYAAGPGAVPALLERWLDAQVAVVHEPPEATDGTYPGPLIVAALSARTASLDQLMPDHHQLAEISSTDDQVTVRLTITGTLPDGTALRVEGVDHLALRNHTVVRLTSCFAREQMAPLVAAIRARQQEIPGPAR